MKKLSIIMILLMTSFVFFACDKEEEKSNIVSNNDKQDTERLNERIEINYYIDTSSDTVNNLTSNYFEGPYSWNQYQGEDIENIGNIYWGTNFLADALVIDLDDDHIVFEMQNESQDIYEFVILEDSPERLEFLIPVSDDRTIRYSLTDTEGQIPMVNESFYEGQMVSFQAKAGPWVIVYGAALLVAAGVDYYCSKKIQNGAAACTEAGKCTIVKSCGVECVSCRRE